MDKKTVHIVCGERSGIWYGDQYSERGYSILTPVAVFDDKRKAEAFARKLRDYGSVEIVSAVRAPYNPAEVTPSMKKKMRKK